MEVDCAPWSISVREHRLLARPQRFLDPVADVLTRLGPASPADRSDALARAREQVSSIEPFWVDLVRLDGRPSLLTTALRAATRLDDDAGAWPTAGQIEFLSP